MNRIRCNESKTLYLADVVSIWPETGHIESLSKGAKAKLAVFVNMLEQFKKDIDGSIAHLAERVLNESGLAESFLAAGPEGESALENANELINAAAAYDKQAEQPSLVDYLQQISLFSDTDAYDKSSDRVALMTLHAAKGLEFPCVFIVGCEQGLLPYSLYGYSEADPVEERRLFYVGMTRAKRYLFLSYAGRRYLFGREYRLAKSPFLAPIEEGLLELEQARPRTDRSASAAAQKQLDLF